jgi:hypothetical protein
MSTTKRAPKAGDQAGHQPTDTDLAAIAEDAPSRPSQVAIDNWAAGQEILDLTQAREQRELFARHILMVAKVWLVLLGYVILAQGFGTGIPLYNWTQGVFYYGRFHLSDSILLALLTTSTATVIGVLVVVVRYLFPRR